MSSPYSLSFISNLPEPNPIVARNHPLLLQITQDISTLYTVLIGVRKLDTIREQYGIAIIRGPIIADYARL